MKALLLFMRIGASIASLGAGAILTGILCATGSIPYDSVPRYVHWTMRFGWYALFLGGAICMAAFACGCITPEEVWGTLPSQVDEDWKDKTSRRIKLLEKTVLALAKAQDQKSLRQFLAKEEEFNSRDADI